MAQKILICAAVAVLAILCPSTDAVACKGGKADIVFLIDASLSVKANNFQTMLTFVQNITNALDIGSDKVRVGAIRYDFVAETEFDLNQYMTKEDVAAAVKNISYPGGLTYTNKALSLMRTSGFTAMKGGRAASLVPQIGIVVTDGQSTDSAKTKTEAEAARNASIYMVSVGIGNTNSQELNDIASDPDQDYVFYVSDFDKLDSIEDAIIKRTCTVSKGKPCETEECLLLQILNPGGNGANSASGSLFLAIMGIFLTVLRLL